jgi:hypothetical protein
MRYVGFYGFKQTLCYNHYHTLFNNLAVTLINNKNNIKLQNLTKLLFNVI